MIIIETPAPPTRERLVLVPPESCTPVFDDGKPAGLSIRAQGARDATPADLERAGYVLREQAAPGTLAHLRADLRDAIARAEKAERERDDLLARINDAEQEARTLRAERAKRERAEHERDEQVARAGDAEASRAHAQAARWTAEAERDTLRAEVARLTAPAEGEPTDEELHAAWWTAAGGNVEAHRAVYRLGVAHERARQQPAMGSATDEELERVYSNAYARAWESELSTPDRGERAGVLAVAARVRQERCLIARAVAERDEAREAMASVVGQLRGRDEETQRLAGTLRERNEAKELARVLEVERDTLRAELADAKAERDRAIRDCAATAAERNEARAEVARLGVAHERAMQQPAQDRATDEELERAFYAAYDPLVTNGRGAIEGRSAGLLAVAARVRQERCLVARAVAANVDVRVCEDNDGGFMVGVHATGCDEELARCVPASDVPATLARLLGEVTRG